MPTTAIFRLDTQETIDPTDDIPTYGESLRHSCRPAYLAARQVYSILDSRKDRSRAETLRWCRATAWFCRHDETGEVRIGTNACHLRWCPVCAQARRNHISHSVAEWLGTADYPKFLTLTLKHTDAPLDWQVKNLYNYFRALRRRKEFRQSVTGGVWFFQIKKSKNDSRWHPHLHCLVTGLYLSKYRLHDMWCQITYGSFVADIRTVRDPQKAANDAARYAASPGSLVGLSAGDACELVKAMHGRRICGTWGTGRAVSLRPTKPADADKWHNVGGWYDVMSKRDTDPNARAIFQAWQDKRPLADGIHCVNLVVNEFIKKQKQSTWEDLDKMQKTERDPP